MSNQQLEEVEPSQCTLRLTSLVPFSNFPDKPLDLIRKWILPPLVRLKKRTSYNSNTDTDDEKDNVQSDLDTEEEDNVESDVDNEKEDSVELNVDNETSVNTTTTTARSRRNSPKKSTNRRWPPHRLKTPVGHTRKLTKVAKVFYGKVGSFRIVLNDGLLGDLTESAGEQIESLNDATAVTKFESLQYQASLYEDLLWKKGREDPGQDEGHTPYHQRLDLTDPSNATTGTCSCDPRLCRGGELGETAAIRDYIFPIINGLAQPLTDRAWDWAEAVGSGTTDLATLPFRVKSLSNPVSEVLIENKPILTASDIYTLVNLLKDHPMVLTYDGGNKFTPSLDDGNKFTPSLVKPKGTRKAPKQAPKVATSAKSTTSPRSKNVIGAGLCTVLGQVFEQMHTNSSTWLILTNYEQWILFKLVDKGTIEASKVFHRDAALWGEIASNIGFKDLQAITYDLGPNALAPSPNETKPHSWVQTVLFSLLVIPVPFVPSLWYTKEVEEARAELKAARTKTAVRKDDKGKLKVTGP